jgi:ribosomal protein S18 acetylase RimI-like enzyme
VLPIDAQVEQRDGYLVARSPSNPAFFWGNFLLFDAPPKAGDAERWDKLFELEFENEPRVRHRAFGWDRADGAIGLAREEFQPRGYELDEIIGLVVESGRLAPHPRENREVAIRPLEPAPGAEEALWAAVLEIQVANREERFAEDAYRTFARARLTQLRARLDLGEGAWYVAVEPARNEVVACCGIVVKHGRGRFQIVDTALAHRRKGICSRLVVEAAGHAAATFAAERFVIVADAGYHALGLYESLGFSRAEHLFEAFRQPPAQDSH